jgi:uncharacterized SAM-binding protein YcdF (DUF218 family)
MILANLAARVEQMLQPLTWVFLGLAVLGLRSLWMGRRRTAGTCTLLLGILWLVGATPLAEWLLARLERPYVAGSRQVPMADAVVMLGGTHDYSPSTVLPFNLGSSGDRPLVALELMRQGRAPYLVLGGASVPWFGRRINDAEVLDVWIRGWRLPAGRTILLGPSANTRDEAVQVAALVRSNGWRRVLMVSSGFHLRRGEAALRKAGVPDVYAVGAEFNGADRMQSELNWGVLPEVERFRFFAQWVHEQLGYWYYRWKGWA